MGLAFVAIVRLADQIGIADRHATAAFAFQAAFLLAGRLELQADEVFEGLRHLGQRHPVLRALGPGQAGFDVAHVQLQAVAEQRLLAWQAPETLGLAVGLDQIDGFSRPAGQAQVLQGDVVDREETTGGAVSVPGRWR